MTASKYIKSQGLPSLKFVADKVGKPPETLNNWYKHNNALFEVVVAGVKGDISNVVYYNEGYDKGFRDCEEDMAEFL